MPETDRLADRIADGDRAAFRELVLQTSQQLVRFAARILGNVSDAEDAVQEAYVKAHRALTTGTFERRAKLSTWLYRVVLNTSIDLKRREKRRPTTFLSDTGPAEPRALHPERAEQRLALRELSDWLQALPEEQQGVVLLKCVEGFSSRETAEVLDCSEGAVEQRLVRARRALRSRRHAS